MAQYSKSKNQFVDRNNNLFDVVMMADQDGNIINSAPAAANINIAMGNLEGWDSEHVIGAVPAMSQNHTGTIWDVNDTNYPFEVMNTPSQLTVTCSATEVGHRVVLDGLNENWDHITEVVETTSTTNVSTNQFVRLHSATYLDGAVTTNVNQILITHPNGGTPVTVGRIAPNRGRTAMGIWSVPRGHVAFITRGAATCQANADATIDMYVKYGTQVNYVIGHSFELSGTGGMYDYTFTVPLMIPEFSDINTKATVRSNNARVTCAFDIIVVAVENMPETLIM